MAELHRLRPNQLRVTEPLPWNVVDRSGQLLLRKGYVIQRDTQIDQLIERGMFVDAEDFRAQLEYESHAARQAYDPLAVWKRVQSHLGALFAEPPQDGSFPGQVEDLARQVIDLCNRRPDFALAAIMLLDYRRYPLAHSLHVAVLCELIARRGEFDEATRLSLSCAALTQNVGMIELQQLLSHHRGGLSDEQRAAVHQHPMAGARLLQSYGVTDREWLRAVLEHHETPQGSGYPRKTPQPSMQAMLIGTCDVFAAHLSPRAYRKPLAAPDAAKKLYVERGQGSDNPFPGLLVKAVGMYPPGTFVRLANGEIGVVWGRNPEAMNQPQVAVLISAKGLRHMDPVRRDTGADPAFKVVAVLPPDNPMFTVNFEQLWCR